MKNIKELQKRIEEGIAYIDGLDKELRPIIDYLVNNCLTHAQELSPDKSFEYLVQFMGQKTECLLLLTKMKEILEYTASERN